MHWMRSAWELAAAVNDCHQVTGYMGYPGSLAEAAGAVVRRLIVIARDAAGAMHHQWQRITMAAGGTARIKRSWQLTHQTRLPHAIMPSQVYQNKHSKPASHDA